MNAIGAKLIRQGIPQVLADIVAHAEAEADLVLVVGVGRQAPIEDIHAGADVLVQEIGVGETDRARGPLAGNREVDPSVLSLSEQVALAKPDIAERAEVGRVAGSEGQFAGGLLLHLDLDDGLVRRCARYGRYVDRFEEAEVAKPLLGAMQLLSAE